MGGVWVCVSKWEESLPARTTAKGDFNQQLAASYLLQRLHKIRKVLDAYQGKRALRLVEPWQLSFL